MDWVQVWMIVEKPAYILAALAVIAGVFYVIRYVRDQRRSKLLSQGAAWAYGYAEKWGQEYLSGKSDTGTQKFKKALSFLESFAKDRGIPIKADVLEAAIQLAWQQHEGKAKLQSEKGQVEAVMKRELDRTVKPH